MSIKDICNKELITIDKGAHLKEAASIMQRKHVGSLIVTEASDGKRMAAGIITDRDIALSLASPSKAQDLTVQQIMKANPITVKASEGIYETITKMRKHGIKRVPVVNDDGSLHGIICADDLISLLGDEINTLSKIQEVQVMKEKHAKTSTASPTPLSIS